MASDQPSQAEGVGTLGKLVNVERVLMPNVTEALQLDQLENNLLQTEDYITKFSDEKETLGITVRECEEIVRLEFSKLRQLLM